MRLDLLHLCDSLFPIGSFVCSDGLESATAWLKPDASESVEHLREWLDVCLDETIGRLEGPAVGRAWQAATDRDWRALTTIDSEMTALRPSASARATSRAMGVRLLTTWAALYPDARLDEILLRARQRLIGPTLPIAFGSACACRLISERDTIEAFAYTRLSAAVSAAMRLMPIGQTGAHTLLARALDRVPAVVGALMARNAGPESFTPELDIALMTHQYLHARLFRT